MVRLRHMLIVAMTAILLGLPISSKPAFAGVSVTDSQRATDRVRYPQARLPALELPDGSRKIVHSVLKTTKQLGFGDFIWNDSGVLNGDVWVLVDLAHQTISVFRSGDEIGSAVILYGAPGHPTPKGIFQILEKNPRYVSRKYQAPMPFMLRLTQDGVAIHGSDVKEGWATHGCVGVPLAFARMIFSVVRKGDLVAIL